MERSWQACQAELEALKLKYLLQGELGGLDGVTSQQKLLIILRQDVDLSFITYRLDVDLVQCINTTLTWPV